VVYDKLSRIKQVLDPIGGQVDFAYDANGNLTTFQDQNGNATGYSYNNLSKRHLRTDALTRQDTTLYDGASKFLRFTDRKGQVSGATYDNANRLKVLGFGASVGNPTAYQSTLTYSYDAGNRVTDIVDSLNGTLHRDYDGLDRLVQEQQPPRGTVSYTYDAAGRRATMTVQGQPTLYYSYDNANRLTKIESGPQGSALGTVSFTYEGHRRKTTTLANGVVMTNDYDNADQLTGITYAKGGITIGNLTYSYDADGRRVAMGGSLAQIVLPPAIASATYNANNQLLQWGSQTLGYDFNGNLTGDGTKTLTWDSRDQLTGLSGSLAASFGYDGVGRRVSKTVAGTHTGYVYDGQNFAQELTGTTPKANLITGLGLDEVFLRNQGGASSHHLPDALGSILGLTGGNGALATSYAYEPYGAVTQAGAANENSQQYTGRENDDTGMMYYRARYYDPLRMRFVSEDPIGFEGGSNLYAYVDGNPVDFNDPLGLFIGSGGTGVGDGPACGFWDMCKAYADLARRNWRWWIVYTFCIIKNKRPPDPPPKLPRPPMEVRGSSTPPTSPPSGPLKPPTPPEKPRP
jgi:RHS repeat-associated protein